jgi:hypothetical protein
VRKMCSPGSPRLTSECQPSRTHMRSGQAMRGSFRSGGYSRCWGCDPIASTPPFGRCAVASLRETSPPDLHLPHATPPATLRTHGGTPSGQVQQLDIWHQSPGLPPGKASE